MREDVWTLKKVIWKTIAGIVIALAVTGFWGQAHMLPVQAAQTDEKTGEESWIDIMDDVSFDEIDAFLSDTGLETTCSFGEMVMKFVKNDGEVDIEDVFYSFMNIFVGDIGQYKALFVQIILMAACFALLHNFTNVFRGSQISMLCFYMFYLGLITLLMRSYLSLHQVLSGTMERLMEFMRALLPAFCMTLTFSASSLTAASFYQVTLLVIWLVEWVLLHMIVPLIHVYVMMELLNYMTKETMISKLTALLKSITAWSMKALFGVVAGINIVQGLITPALDNFRSTSLSKTVQAIPGVGNAMGAVANMFIGSAVIVKNGVGVAALIILLLLCASPMIQTVAGMLLYRITGALVEPFSDKRISGCITSVGVGAGMLAKAMGMTCVLFMLTIAIVTATVR